MEDMRYLFGLPTIVIGAVGLLVAVLVMVGGEAGDTAAPGRSGWQAFIALAWLTLIEYIVAVATSYNIVLLVLIALAKVGLIAWFFMHVARVGGHEEH
jgi:ABC-type phosphate transport system permease subunit